MSNKKIIYYYQTFIGLKKLLNKDSVTHIIVSSIHFGYEKKNIPYIHLNDNNPNDIIYDKLWNDIILSERKGIIIMLMIGGAGKAFQELFSNFNIFYELLKNEIKRRPYIKGVDLDVEEIIPMEYIQCLINQLNKDFGEDFIITMAPLGSSLQYDNSGMAGFCYKQLFNSPEGKRINWFNGQYYNNYTESSYDQTILNGYPPSKIIFGMISSQFNNSNFQDACKIIKKISNKYNDFNGVFNWEYFDSPPNKNDPSEWADLIKKSIF